jgi:riboflavin kinase/FMN adenylyltransferase
MKEEKRIFALGFFDGVHLGHQALVTACCHLAKRTGCIPGAVTFTSHPDALVTSMPPLLINTISQRQQLLLAYGIADILALPFDEGLRNMPWQAFLDFLLEKGAAGFVCGNDFRFGRGGEGSAAKLASFCQARNLPYAIVPEQTLDGMRISSTHIRALIENGDMETAARFLGHPHTMCGEVVHGRQLGRTIGIPTANLSIPAGVVVPKHGVYATTCVFDGEQHAAVTNIGSRPTVGGHQVRAESWILDFDGDLYGKTVTLLFHKFLRPEQKFDSLGALQEEILKNAAETRKIFGKT